MFLLDLRPKGLTGKEVEGLLGKVGITVNKNAIPNDPEKPAVTSGIRLGSPAMTTRGFGLAEARKVGELIADVLDAPGNRRSLARVGTEVRKLCRRYPVYARRAR
jgi:glycine hydroxymethyltransferase